MIPQPEQWLELRSFRALRGAGLSLSQSARETGLDRKTVREISGAWCAARLQGLQKHEHLCLTFRGDEA